MNTFEKYPDLQIVADSLDNLYKVKYLECVQERGSIRFEKKEKIVSREVIESLVNEIIFMINNFNR
jgi:hypothetical protein